ncbi:ComEC/Rec2 family competence protein [Tenacibaculum sp. 1_MG-2023]|uniref:ComEC/Rec2 family competence protein n=1 Tax=Tenacibaculum sp. 1_MG-2023 TaxID=3062653 RepID=UPI0026E29016|nr:ComEC/Rec2 family competence protein [Tenacibaculum sp. 1_MG-2023]MDO6676187.1 ComEC/Rec2 family competence protein [Tenacibaculum sp. 1_MG-2023]
MKKLLEYPLFHFLLCLILGIALQFYTQIWQFNFIYLFYSLIGFLVILYFLKRTQARKTFSIATLLFFVFIGISTTYIHNPKNYVSHYKHQLTKNSTYILDVQKVLKPGNYYTKYVVKVSQVDSTKTTGYILLNIQKDSLSPILKVGNRIFIKTPFKELIPPLNPHQFNYKQYLAKQYVYHQVFIDDHQFKKLENSKLSLINLSAHIRGKIQASLKKYHFTNDEFAVINALLLGQRQEISKELLESYTNAGAIHILAISGLHIGILLWLLSYLFKPLEKLPYGTIIKTVCLIFLLWSFAFIAGLSASVVRAVTMFTFVAFGLSFKRKKVIEFSLISSMLFLLLIKPMFLFDVGFQLSYLAVFGIVWVQPLLYNLWTPKLRFLDKGWQLFTVSVAAQIGILPVSLYYFHQFPGLFILSNLIIIPFLSAILFGGIVIILLATFSILPQFMADIYGFIISLMNYFVNWVSHQEVFLLKEIPMSLTTMVAWYIFIILLYKACVHKTLKRITLLLTSIIVLQGVYFYEKHQISNKDEFIVFHKSRQSVLGKRSGKELSIFSSLNDSVLLQQKLLQSYRVGEDVSSKSIDSVFNIIPYKNKQILIVDSLGVYQINGVQNPIVILQNSPKINLTRLISTLKPQQIIADGSNYKSYVIRWKETCYKQKTPFWYTGQNGAYIFKD